jgi:hypothetical protein
MCEALKGYFVFVDFFVKLCFYNHFIVGTTIDIALGVVYMPRGYSTQING